MLYSTRWRKNDFQRFKETIGCYWIKYPTSSKPLVRLIVEMSMRIKGKHFIMLVFKLKLLIFTNAEKLS